MNQRNDTRFVQSSVHRWRLRAALWAAVGLGAIVASASAQQPAPVPADKTAPKGAAEKLVSLDLENAPWMSVLDWYAKETGLTLVAMVRPTGSVTIKPGPGRTYTLGEVTDLLNEALTQQKFLLIRYQTSFTVWPADERIDPTRLPRVEEAELARRGKTEMVVCNVGPFNGAAAKDVMPQVEKMLSPFGQAVLLTTTNSIQIVDTAGNITRIQRTLPPRAAPAPAVPAPAPPR